MEAKEFKDGMNKSNTYSDMFALIKQLSPEQTKELKQALIQADKWVGITMRDKALLRRLGD